jgi:hypothetical protein
MFAVQISFPQLILGQTITTITTTTEFWEDVTEYENKQ